MKTSGEVAKWQRKYGTQAKRCLKSVSSVSSVDKKKSVSSDISYPMMLK